MHDISDITQSYCLSVNVIFAFVYFGQINADYDDLFIYPSDSP